MFTQLNPPVPLHVLEKGDGFAIGLIDYGQEHNLLWVTALNDSGEIWCAPNPQVRMGSNWSMGRKQNPLVAVGKALDAAEKALRAAEAKNSGLCADCVDAMERMTG